MRTKTDHSWKVVKQTKLVNALKQRKTKKHKKYAKKNIIYLYIEK